MACRRLYADSRRLNAFSYTNTYISFIVFICQRRLADTHEVRIDVGSDGRRRRCR